MNSSLVFIMSYKTIIMHSYFTFLSLRSAAMKFKKIFI